MSIRTGKAGVLAALVATFFLFSAAGRASADPVPDGGELYMVTPNGTTSFDGATNYTVLQLMTFSPDSPALTGLVVTHFPLYPSAPILPGSEFFLVGAFHSMSVGDHLLLGAGTGGTFPFPFSLTTTIHDNLIGGVDSLFLTTPPVSTPTTTDFWSHFADGTQSDLFGLIGSPLNQLDGLTFDMGAEQVFGFSEYCYKPPTVGTLSSPGGDLTMGLSFTTGSGKTYTAPEPALPLLLLAGIAGVVFFRRRRLAA